MPAQQCIQGRADRRNLASAPLIATRSPDPAPTTTKSSCLDGFCHPLHHGQIATARGPFRTSTPRGFLPWTLSDDGPGAFPRCRNGPSSETLHRSGHFALGRESKGRPRALLLLPLSTTGHQPCILGTGAVSCPRAAGGTCGSPVAEQQRRRGLLFATRLARRPNERAMVMARRIVSFLPSATEMACALGLSDQLLGVSHECDYPRAVRDKPIVVRSVLPI